MSETKIKELMQENEQLVHELRELYEFADRSQGTIDQLEAQLAIVKDKCDVAAELAAENQALKVANETAENRAKGKLGRAAPGLGA